MVKVSPSLLSADFSNLREELKKVIEQVKFKDFRMVGRYAVGIEFSDGHDLGMYAYDYLYSLCQCDLCRDDVIRIQGPLH